MPTPATITVNFTANYAGPHRICWGQVFNIYPPPYVCTNIVNCTGGGNVCSATITVMVDNESCAQVTFEGYIQATCNPEGSSVDRIFWSYTFTPNPTCTGYNLLCTNPIAGFCDPILPAIMGLNCNGTARPTIGPINDGFSVPLCSNIDIVLPAGYSIAPSTICCYECTNYQIDIECLELGCAGTAEVYYTDCGTRELIRLDYITFPISLTVCAVTDSVYVQASIELNDTVTPTGPC